ncbi:T9SS type B sorting domain-containing protein [Winogradskyella litorisediminis]|uniref:T9SS type B sorting domain-containing protein n=1 Tax=Winogradskyella litorisediminis TaxID=1156618 RepID=A0ABW3N473_9FLAO
MQHQSLNILKFLFSTLSILSVFFLSYSQTVLFSDILVSDVGTSNNIGSANTSRNIAVDNIGNIYIAFAGSEGIRVSKSEDRGASFLPSVQISSLSTFVEPEIAINSNGDIFVAWIENSAVTLSISTDSGVSFSTPNAVSATNVFSISCHMTTFDSNVYIVDQSGANVFVNNNNGNGTFTTVNLPTYVYADILTDQNGVVFAPRDNPSLELYDSTDDGQIFNQIPLTGDGDVFFSSYSISDGPCGTFLFVAGEGSIGYKIDTSTGIAEQITFGTNTTAQGRTLFSDNQGTIIDGYRDFNSNLVMSVSFNQGEDFETPIVISDGDSHNISRNTTFNDIVVTYSKNGQVFSTIYTDLLKGIEITEPNPAIDTCAGTNFNLPFTLSGTFAPDTLFTAVLSDEFGNFTNGTTVGQITTNTDNSISISLPNNLENSGQYRLLIESIADCTQSAPITISVGNVQINTIDTISQCANDNGLSFFDLDALTPQIIGSQSNIDVTFYPTENDANNLTNQITTSSNYESASGFVWARGQSTQSVTCFGLISIELEVFDLPAVILAVNLEQCDTDQDGITIFNLNEANILISNNSTYNFSYYTSLNSAETENATDEILNFTSYENVTPLNDVIYARIENENNCYKISEINLAVEATQIPQDFQLIYESCDDTILGSNTDGISNFDFSDATAQIESLFASGQNLETTYYLSENDALQELNSITDITNFRNQLSPNSQTIWVRVDNTDINGCQGLGPHIILNVDSVPINNAIAPYELCSSTGEAEFDLTSKNNEVIGTQTRTIIVRYYTSLENAENDIPIAVPTAFTSAGQTIFVRATFDTNDNGVPDAEECFNAIDMSFDLVVLENPTIFSPTSIDICSTEINTLYNLTIREDEITGNDDSISITYYENQTDFENNTPIPNPENYIHTQLTSDLIVLATAGNSCFSIETLTLNTIIFDEYNFTPNPIEECEVDNDGFDNFDITRIVPDIMNLLDNNPSNDLDANDYIFTYYEFEALASANPENTSAAINNPLSFTNNIPVSQNLYVRVTPIDPLNQQCFVVIPFVIIVNPVPEIAIEDNYVICLSNTEMVVDSDTTVLPNPPIDTMLNSAEYTFQWYSGTEQETIDNPAEILISGATGPTFSPVQEGNYTIIATNNATGCTISATTNVAASYPPEEISIELISAAFSGNNTLQASVIGNGDYEFSLDNGPYQASGTFTNVAGGLHEIFVRDLYNCEIISVTKSIIDYPLYFTPNNDGNHDTWNIKSIANQPDAKIYIFDRYGKLLKQLSPTGAGWDGTYNGNNMPTSDYWFSVEYTEPLDGIKRVFKSHFTLKR